MTGRFGVNRGLSCGDVGCRIEAWRCSDEILVGGQIGASAGAVAATAGMGGFPMVASMVALGYSGSKGIRLSVGELSEKYEHWKKAHKV